MEQSKVLLLLDEIDFFADQAKKKGIQVERIYKKCSGAAKCFRRLHMYLHFPFYSIWIDRWKRDLGQYEAVIIHASVIKVPVVKYIHKKYPKLRIILWYWNPVSKCVDPNKICGKTVEKWSFDKQDCIDYGMNYNTQFYFDTIRIRQREPKQDVVFVGADKGRWKQLFDFSKECENRGITTELYVTPSKRFERKKGRYQKTIPYERILEKISKSRAILDIVSEGQQGLTLRPLEALFLQKKLITNDKSIIDYDFYDANNIFVIGIDEMEKLSVFLERPYHPVDATIRRQYDFSNWLERFFTGQENYGV